VDDEQNRTTKKRKLRLSSETVRERAQKNKIKLESGRRTPKQYLKYYLGYIKTGLGYVFRPIKFIGHYIVPPYFRNSWRELKLVTWPTRKQSRQLTLAVIIFSVVLGSFVALLDLGFGKLFKEVIVK
jgi:preprotein translocase subunit SecE